MTAERRDRDRAAHLRAHLAGAAERWGGGPAAGEPRTSPRDGTGGCGPASRPAGSTRMSAAGSAAAAASDEPSTGGATTGPAAQVYLVLRTARRRIGRYRGASGRAGERDERRSRGWAARGVGGRDGPGGPAADGRDPSRATVRPRRRRSAAEEWHGRRSTGTVGPPRHGAGTDTTRCRTASPARAPGRPVPGGRWRVVDGDALWRTAGGDGQRPASVATHRTDGVVGVRPTATVRAAAGGAAADPLFGPVRTRDPASPDAVGRLTPGDSHSSTRTRCAGTGRSRTRRSTTPSSSAPRGSRPTRPWGDPESAALDRRGPVRGVGPDSRDARERTHASGTHANGTHRNGAARPLQGGAQAGDPAPRRTRRQGCHR